MLAYETRDRLSAASVHDRALELAERAPGLALKRWARQAVLPILAERARCAVTPLIARPAPSTHFTPVEGSAPDAERRSAVPVVLGETAPVTDASIAVEQVWVATPASAPTTARSAARTPRLAAGLVIAVGAGGVWWAGRPDPTPQVPEEPAVLTELPTEAGPVDVAAPAPQEAQAPPEGQTPSLTPTQTAPSPARAKLPTGASSSNTIVAESPSPSAPVLACTTGPGRVLVDLSSNPLGVEVWADGSRLGSTPLFDCGLPEGNLRVTMKLQDQSTTHEIRVSSRAARNFVWDVETDRWIVGR